MVEAIQTLFVPVAIYNNFKGEDERVLKYFKEPSWNNPVVRIINVEQQELTSRVYGDYTIWGLVNAVDNALKSEQKPIPPYFEMLKEELGARQNGTKRAVFAMYCFWSGEATFGKIPGVISTKAGFMEGKEVVDVEFDAQKISYKTLVQKAKTYDCTNMVFVENEQQREVAIALLGEKCVRNISKFELDKEPKYYLFHSPLKNIPMTKLQATRINATIKEKGKAENLLSLQQKELLKSIQKYPNIEWPNTIEIEFLKAWVEVSSILEKLEK